ncbi:aspartate ammonia-lyase [Corynebacterium sp. 320]|uniref:Aspartate ammonia-lyase n=1 Tax=Corynebacterium zhongnanshanii TaxID=2768834 RepID=A0ABQ6VGS0_9CORY|nr:MULTISPECIES: aspartate ammonia-lyase [Corynebacterium]KAB1503635.1 aspartate ammonia-lyase [Corynebacterium sp. 320]KAB1553264.1 aspartate ammonia-lyase [Corynebacterium sp. 321]KAB1553517.1 aspartate ammonia-lyase [Corynebacterium sp. 319]KAB3523513.1 aspartate ammonia-lyase [Corynebacterium zhongnanshanii]KAB3527771.1 aspartate ammonia-lyase [Corynebacterium sp. 250]
MAEDYEVGTSPTYRAHPGEKAGKGQDQDSSVRRNTPLVSSTDIVTSAETHSLEARSSNNFRTEEDLLGELDIPVDAYYGVHTLRAVDNFQISRTTINQLPEFIRGMVMVKKATALANNEVGALSDDKKNAIVWACDQVLENHRAMDQFPIDVFQGGAGTSVNMNTNEVIANLALEYIGEPKGSYDVIHPNDDVNMSQSTNDAYPTGFRLGLHFAIDQLIMHLEGLRRAFEAKGREFKHILKMGRTQLQDAVPMSLGDEFKAFANNLSEEKLQLQRAQAQLREVNMSGTAIGTGVNTPPGYQDAVIKHLSEVTKLEIVPASDLIEATSDTGAYVNAHAAMKRVAMKLSKISNDLRLLSSGPRAGLNEINLPPRQAGSSIMPAKVNPVIPEVVNQIAFKVFGNDVTVSMAAEAGQLQLNVMEPVIAQCAFESVRFLARACTTLRTLCVVGITANEDVCREFVENSIGIITYLNPLIGHHNGDLIGKEAAATGKSVRELVLEKELLDEKTLDDVLSPENLLNPRWQGKKK